MNLKERLMADLKEAMRSRDVPRRGTIRLVRSAIKNAEIEWQRDATDEQILEIIAREAKRRIEAIEAFRQGGREDLVAMEQAELAILEQYLPEQLSQEEIKRVVQQVITELGASGMGQMGPVMRQAMAQLKGKADGRLVNQVAREILSSL